MQIKKLFKQIAVLTAVLFAANVSFASADAHGGEAKEEKFNPTEMIMHHIGDAHEWHVTGDITVPLPVILFANNGLTVFMSSEFHHDDKGTQVVEKNGERFVKFHEKIYYASETADAHGAYLELDEAHHATNERPLDFSITKNVVALFVSAILLILIFSASAKNYRTNSGAPKGIAAFMEPLVVFVRDEIAIPNIGEKKYMKFMPYLLTVFFFIWINNLLGLVPFIPGGANLTGNIYFTMTMAGFTFIITTINGNADYWKHIFWMPGVPVPIRILLAPIELAGAVSKPFALMIRLFANITAGHIIILSLMSLIFIFKTVAISPVSIAFGLFMNVMELLVAALQAFIFTLLSALFIGMAVEEHDHH